MLQCVGVGFVAQLGDLAAHSIVLQCVGIDLAAQLGDRATHY